MKKLLLILGVVAILSTSAFAWGGHGNNNCQRRGNNSGKHMSNGNHHMGNEKYSEEEYEVLKKAREENYDRYGKDMKSINLDIEKELLEDKPDWNKIEKWNQELANIQSKCRTDIMKVRSNLN